MSQVGCTTGGGGAALGGQALKVCNYFQKKNCALPRVQFRKAPGEMGRGDSALFVLGCSLVLCSMDLSRGEAAATEKEGGVNNCLPGREGWQHLVNVEFLVVYVHFRSSVYIQKIPVHLAVLSGLEFSGNWNAFLTLLSFFPILIHSLGSVTVNPVVVGCMQLPP